MIRVAYIGDSPFINSGFGVVARSIMTRWPEDFEVHVLGTMHTIIPKNIEPYESYEPVCMHDVMGFHAMVPFLVKVNPDVCFFVGDPGTLRNRFGGLIHSGRFGLLPFVTYFPLEGAPFNPHIVEQARMVFAPITYTQWGASELARFGVDADWAWHGRDHADFHKYSVDRREGLRGLVKWDDKFVVGTVGVNKRTNRYPALIEAAKILKDRGLGDRVVFYFHTQKTGEGLMGGWELDWMPKAYDVEDMIVFKPNQEEHHLMGKPRESNATVDMIIPTTSDGAMENLSQFGFIDMLNCLDLYIDAASAHGFNLPLLEAICCGVPTATVNDGFARVEIFKGASHFMEPTGWDHWHTGAHLPLVSPKRIADTIELFMEDPGYGESISGLATRKFEHVLWQNTADKVAEKIRHAHEYGLEITKHIGKQERNLPNSHVSL